MKNGYRTIELFVFFYNCMIGEIMVLNNRNCIIRQPEIVIHKNLMYKYGFKFCSQSDNIIPIDKAPQILVKKAHSVNAFLCMNKRVEINIVT